MRVKKVFYILEQIDVDGDKINDGFLASQYRIDKYGNKIFIKNKYITFADFKSKVNKNGGRKSKSKKTLKLQKNENDVVIMSKDDYNKFMNQNAYQNQYPHQYPPQQYHPQQYHPQQYHPQQYHPQYPPGVLVNSGSNTNNNSFTDNLTQGVGLGFGFAAGDALFDGVASFF